MASSSPIPSPHAALMVHPYHLPSPEPAHLRARASQVLRVVATNFAGLAWQRARGRDLAPNAFARPLRLTFEALGATFMKFGQMIASAPGVFGDDLAAEFRSCLDTGPAVPWPDVKRAIENEFGLPIDEAFASFDPDPLAAASIAVVHVATLHDGTKVAVKVLRPGIEETVACDLRLIGPLVELLAKLIGAGIAGRLLQLVDGFREQVSEELDLRNEARTLRYYEFLLGKVDLAKVCVPVPYEQRCGRTVLTMQFLDGVPVDDLATIATMGVDPSPLVEQMVRANFMTLLRNGVFHGDVHAGNLLLLTDGRLAMIDWGIVGRLDPTAHKFFRRIIEAAIGDETAWADVADYLVKIYGPVFQQALGLDDAGLALWMRNMVGPMLNRPFGELSLSEFLMAPQRELEKNNAAHLEGESAWVKLRKWWELRKLQDDPELFAGLGSEFDRSIFLLTKQLMYFERYGKMFLGDVAILNDKEFFGAILADAPIV